MASEMVKTATSDKLKEMDWAKNIEICELVARDPGKAKDIIKAIKKCIGSRSKNTQLYAVMLLEMLLNNCGEPIHRQVIDNGLLPILVKIVKKKTELPVREKIFLLLDATQTSLGGAKAKFPQYYEAYYDLVSAGVQFSSPNVVVSRAEVPVPETRTEPQRESLSTKLNGGQQEVPTQPAADTRFGFADKKKELIVDRLEEAGDSMASEMVKAATSDKLKEMDWNIEICELVARDPRKEGKEQLEVSLNVSCLSASGCSTSFGGAGAGTSSSSFCVPSFHGASIKFSASPAFCRPQFKRVSAACLSPRYSKSQVNLFTNVPLAELRKVLNTKIRIKKTLLQMVYPKHNENLWELKKDRLTALVKLYGLSLKRTDTKEILWSKLIKYKEEQDRLLKTAEAQSVNKMILEAPTASGMRFQVLDRSVIPSRESESWIYAHDLATPAELKDMEKEIRKDVDAAIAKAKESSMPDTSELFKNVYKKGYGVEGT